MLRPSPNHGTQWMPNDDDDDDDDDDIYLYTLHIGPYLASIQTLVPPLVLANVPFSNNAVRLSNKIGFNSWNQLSLHNLIRHPFSDSK